MDKGLVRDAVSDVGDISIDALAESIDAHSPSRRTRELAEMWGIGYLERIESFRRPAYMTAREVGENSVEGLTNPFSSLNSQFDDLYRSARLSVRFWI